MEVQYIPGSLISNARLLLSLKCPVLRYKGAWNGRGGPPRPATTILSKSKALPYSLSPIYSAGRHYLGFVRWYLVGKGREREREREGWREGEGEDLVSGSIWHGRPLRRAAANRAVGFSERSAMCCKHRNAAAERGVSDVKIALGVGWSPLPSSLPICKLHT